MTDICFAELLGELSKTLPPKIDAPSETALVLLAFITGKPKTWVLAHADHCPDQAQIAQLQTLATRLQAGEPLPYLTGTQAFFGLDFKVSPAVLIPRPETELLVEAALAWLREQPSANCALDLGTGSGCIAVSLAVHAAALRLTASDLSPEALQIAQQNAQTHQVTDRIRFVQADCVPPGTDQFDLVCANLPYIPTEKLGEVNSLPYEPIAALDGGLTGLEVIRRCLSGLVGRIRQPGLILLETESSLGQQTAALSQNYFPEGKITLIQDLAGHDRLVRIDF